ncbi:MAG: TetR/AcrR family transcriptional regulator [Cyanobacteria bacterium J06627_8]
MPRHPSITNEEILEAARHVFLEQGFGASTVDIAEKAGISEASIFKRFSTKQALFEAAMGISKTPEWINELAHQTPSEDFKTELTNICKQMLAFYQEVVPRIMMIMGQGKTSYPPQVSSPPPPIRDVGILSRYIEQATTLGYLGPCDSTTLGRLLVGAMMNYVIGSRVAAVLPDSAPVSAPTAIAPDEFIHNLIEILWGGIAPDS